ncbi:MAG: winged helix-turn-helix domain-containing protein [Candidatus Eremiobacteraeota bacterium]|nr:winged helix-turn-helix domain-containing protein [Candidatus Eremiobacteraeota bacterium]
MLNENTLQLDNAIRKALARAEVREAANIELDLLAAEIRRDGIRVTLSRCERSLLALLGVQRRPCSRDELADALYPHLDPHIAAIQLKVYVHRVRRRLGDGGAIVFTGKGYKLGDSVRIDLFAAEAEVLAATRAKGNLSPKECEQLLSFRERLRRRDKAWTGDCEWSTALERRLEALAFDVTTALGEAALAVGDCATATSLAAEVFELDPCDERGAELAIRAALCVGDRALAMRHLRRYERLVKEEFDAKPSPDLLALLDEKAVA